MTEPVFDTQRTNEFLVELNNIGINMTPVMDSAYRSPDISEAIRRDVSRSDIAHNVLFLFYPDKNILELYDYTMVPRRVFEAMVDSRHMTLLYLKYEWHQFGD